MAKESKVLRMFRIMNEEYDVKVGKSSVPENGERPLRVTLTVHGVRYVFNSNDDDYRKFMVFMAKEDLSETFSSSNIRDLNLQLETIATIIQTTGDIRIAPSCGCKAVDHVDDE